MTNRERVLTILNGGTPDHVPWFGDLDYWATAMICRNEKPPDFKQSDEYIQWHRDLGVGFYLQGYFPFKEIIENCEVLTWKEGNDRYRQIKTPKGTLRECWRWLDISFSESPFEHLVKSGDDLPAYRYLYENMRYEPDYAFAEQRHHHVGDMGVVLCYLPRSPLMTMLAIDIGIKTIAVLAYDFSEEFEETIRIMKKTLDKACQIAVDSPAEILMIPENLSAEMVGPRLFEKFMRGYQTEWSEKIKAAGKFSCIHMDGTLKGLLREECSVGLSFIEACTPAPVGDLNIEEWREYKKGTDTILWGGIPGSFFTPAVSDEEFDSLVKKVLKVMTSETKYVLGVADQVPPDGLESRVRRVRELVDRYGHYV